MTDKENCMKQGYVRPVISIRTIAMVPWFEGSKMNEFYLILLRQAIHWLHPRCPTGIQNIKNAGQIYLVKLSHPHAHILTT